MRITRIADAKNYQSALRESNGWRGIGLHRLEALTGKITIRDDSGELPNDIAGKNKNCEFREMRQAYL